MNSNVQHSTPDTPEHPVTPTDLDALWGQVSDTIYDYFRTRAALKLTLEYLRLSAAHPNDGPMVEPSARAFVLEDAFEHLDELKDGLDHLEATINTLRLPPSARA